jgi:hypothetical protein
LAACPVPETPPSSLNGAGWTVSSPLTLKSNRQNPLKEIVFVEFGKFSKNDKLLQIILNNFLNLRIKETLKNFNTF